MLQSGENFTEDQLPQIADKILNFSPKSRILAFYGKMGVGKTTLIKAICERLNVVDTVGSPTFSIINQYITRNDDTLFHFDFYRIKKLEEAFDIGYEDYFFSNNYCFLEWPEKIEELLPSDCIRVYLQEKDGIRNIKIKVSSD
jgi:tRNA threonylcarbamoyladenosine biosynthesis protein TsaE